VPTQPNIGLRAIIGCAIAAGHMAGQAEAGPPLDPSVATMAEIGRPGGDLHMLAASSQDTRLLVVYGYARLVGYDLELNLVPDILSAVEVEDGRAFTLRLR
jgi:peptide/nickel transport system substrate-binding protein